MFLREQDLTSVCSMIQTASKCELEEKVYCCIHRFHLKLEMYK